MLEQHHGSRNQSNSMVKSEIKAKDDGQLEKEVSSFGDSSQMITQHDSTASADESDYIDRALERAFEVLEYDENGELIEPSEEKLLQVLKILVETEKNEPNGNAPKKSGAELAKSFKINDPFGLDTFPHSKKNTTPEEWQTVLDKYIVSPKTSLELDREKWLQSMQLFDASEAQNEADAYAVGRDRYCSYCAVLYCTATVVYKSVPCTVLIRILV